MYKINLILLVSVMALITACGPSRDKSAMKIKAVEDRLFSPDAGYFNRASADSLLNMYTDFIKEFPTDTLVPEYIFKSGSIAMNEGNGEKAIGYFDLYMNQFPDKSRAPVCLFFKAYVYENVLRNMDKAKELYITFAEKYPNHPLANDAKLAVENLGKSPEQMIREFEAKQKADSLAALQAKKK
jgi:outer membrane protein assembly factor BamD (BamD/ComL family)